MKADMVVIRGIRSLVPWPMPVGVAALVAVATFATSRFLKLPKRSNESLREAIRRGSRM